MPTPNQLNLVFGPAIPAEIKAVDISFIASPTLKSDSAVAVLSAERYVRENYPHIRDFPLQTESTTASSFIYVNYSGTDVLGMYPNTIQGFGIQGPITNAENHTVSILHNPISLQGLYLSKASSWLPIIKQGCIWRYHIIKKEEFNTGTVFDSNGAPVSGQVDIQESWLARSGLKPGDEVFLIYTVPEHRYGELTNSSSSFPGSSLKLRLNTEICTIPAPNKIYYRTKFKELREVRVGGVVKFQGCFDNSDTDTFIKNINYELQTIEVKESLPPDAIIEIITASVTNVYFYNGYRSVPSETWYPFDANPEYGHYIGDPSTGLLRDSSACLLEQVTLYAIPSAYAKISYGISGDNTNVSLMFKSAFSYNETHFIRHLIGQVEEDIQNRQQDGPTNTWGTAVLGRNFYDEAASYPDDTYSTTVPSLLPLGKVVIAAPASINSVQLGDTRVRGGGVPNDYPLSAVNTNASGLDYLRSFLDLGIWEGAVISDGGILEVHIDTSLLDNYTEDEIFKIVEDHMYPGIDFEIVYRDGV